MKGFSICTGWSKTGKYAALFFSLTVLTLAFLCMNLCIGSVRIPLEETFFVLAGRRSGGIFPNIIWQLRFPRALAAAVLGGALALSGYLLQTFFQNPLAGPFVLGISSGAKLTVALVMVFFLGNAWKVSSVVLISAAFAGAMLSMGFALLVSKRLKGASMLVVAGIMIGYICSAVTDLVVTFADDSEIVNLHNWSMGSFSGISWGNVTAMSVVVFPSVLLAFSMARSITACQLGEAYAGSMGVNIRLLRIALVLLSSVLSGCVTAFAGPVSFVGIAVPQIVKRLFHTAKPLLMIPACFLGGALWCLACDLLARTLFAPTELSISTVTAIFGVPVVIFVMIRQKSESL